MNMLSGYHAVSVVLRMLFKGVLISQYIKPYTMQGFWQTVCEMPPSVNYHATKIRKLT